MVSRDFSGEDVVGVLTSFNYRKDRQRGSHAILKYTNPDTGEIRTVSVPMHDRIRTGTLQNIADQCGANDFNEWCRWIDDHR
ncbi:MAG: type II toxin-antitoxin system HicA family toxin [Euryarchaeota archaeon]|nr:type II toxin-antitoxin system HicA family toxin [Euryarchaeota archaeon]